MTEDQILQLSRWAREAEEIVRHKMAATQLGEAFADIKESENAESVKRSL